MAAWDRKRIDSLISSKIEESLSLDYKAAAALEKVDRKRTEITKDVSAFANSSGGIIVYGIHEDGHLPTNIDPINRNEITREWLEQVIQIIQPKIEGLLIHAICVGPQPNDTCYVVEIPQSITAHMASDNRYYKRYNFIASPMQDYEVRDVMNRKGTPKVQASIFVNLKANALENKGVILVRIENVGTVLARSVMADIEMPIKFGTDFAIDGAIIHDSDNGKYFRLKLTQGLGAPPLFPGSDCVLRHELKHGKFENSNSMEWSSVRDLKIKIFADEMPPLKAHLDFAPATLGWQELANHRVI